MKKLQVGNTSQMVRRSVKEWNKKVVRNPLLAVSIAKNIANGMRFIHSKKIMHRGKSCLPCFVPLYFLAHVVFFFFCVVHQI